MALLQIAGGIDEQHALWRRWMEARRQLDRWIATGGEDFEGVRRMHAVFRTRDAYRRAREAAREERRSRIGHQR